MNQELNLQTWVQSCMTSLNGYDEENQKWQGGRKRCGGKMYSRRVPGSTIWLIHAELRMFPI